MKIIRSTIIGLFLITLILIKTNCGKEDDETGDSIPPAATLSYLWEKSFKTCGGCHVAETARVGSEDSYNLPSLVTKEDFLNLKNKTYTKKNDEESTNFFINTENPKESDLVLTITKEGEGVGTYGEHEASNSTLNSEDSQLLIQWIREGAKDN